MDVGIHSERRAFDEFARADGARLRRALVARYGVDVGCDAAAHALAWSWERWDRVGSMENPAGYLYRVAQTYASRALKSGRAVVLPPERAAADAIVMPLDADLGSALRSLSEPQRTAVLLVHAYGWSPTDVGELTGVAASTVRSHLRRGLRHLRRTLDRGDST